jgi:hypothetical protein
MKAKDFIIKIQNIITSCAEDISEFEIEIQLDSCLNPDKINYSIDFYEQKIIITKGNCGL